MNDMSITIPQRAVDAVVIETRSYGNRLLETGGFLLAPTGSDSVNGVVVAGELGILRRHNLFQISERALDRLFTYADESGFWIPVQFHSHRFGAFMSNTDAEHGLRVEGFVSTIVPQFSHPPGDVGSWGWWQFQHGDWRPCLSAAIHDGEPAAALVFDESGVHER